MAQYWAFINNQVLGPYGLEQLIRLPGFSRQTLVSVDDYSGAAQRWISPAEIPELVRIFQKVEELHDAPIPNPAPRPAAKSRIHAPARLTPVPAPVEEGGRFFGAWLWVALAALLLGGGLFHWNRGVQRAHRAEERQMAQTLIETAPLPSSSLYSSVRQYIQNKRVASRWEFEPLPSGLYNVGLSWMAPGSEPAPLPVYTFEVNLQAQSVRGLNSAAARLLAEGFPAPSSTAPAPVVHHKTPGDFFPAAISDRRQAFEQGDFDAVWKSFSARRKDEMNQGGISAASFTRMQKLTYRPGSGLKQTVLKTKIESDKLRWALLRQNQPRHPDVYIKQRWVWENEAWRLDDEEKKMASGAASASEEAAEASPKPIPPNLPGLSDTPAAR